MTGACVARCAAVRALRGCWSWQFYGTQDSSRSGAYSGVKYKLLTSLGLAFVVIATLLVRYHAPAIEGGNELPVVDGASPETAANTAGNDPGARQESATSESPAPTAPAKPVPPAVVDASLAKTLEAALAMIPAGDFRQALLQLTPASRQRALQKIVKLKIAPHDFATLRVTPTGQLYFVCDFVLPAGAAGTQAVNATGTQEAAAPSTSAAAVPISSPPVRHSRPGATKVLYLDFNGHTITGTNWNTSGGAVTYVAKPFNLSGDDTATFSDAEQTLIIQVWERVAEDFAPFDVDVTTEEPAQFTATTGRAVITANTDANGVLMPSSSSGGVAYLDVFGDSDYATASSPAFVYLQDNAGNIAEAVSHEFGHNMGLSHDGTVAHDAVGAAGYYNGHGSGDISWGPIMGTGYGRNVSQWSKGGYLYADRTTQDDFAIIAGKLTYRLDDAGGTTATAAVAPINGATLAGSGVIASVADADVYAFNTGAGMVSVTASTYRAATGTHGGNADLKLELLDAGGAVVASADPATTTGASLSYAAAAGKYFIRLSASGTGDPFNTAGPTGYTSYGSAGQYTLTGAAVAASPVIVSATAASTGAGQLFSFTVLGSNSATAYSATGLPPGLSIAPTTGVISGRPTSTGVFNVSLEATNATGTGIGSLAITVTDSVPAITAQTSGRQSVARSGSLTLSVTALSANGAPTFQWKRNGQPVADATASTLNLTNATMVMAGWYQVLVTNTIGTTVSAPMFVQVAPATTGITGWGLNTSGETTIPVGLTDAIAISAGSTHALALKANGTVVAWGSNGDGEATVPVGLNDVVAIDAGQDFSLALKADGTVVGWGYNDFDQLDVPPTLTGVVAIAAGNYHSLALKADGTVVGWGYGGSGQTTIPGGLANVIAISAGPQFSLAVKSDGTVVAWGYNGNGETNVPGGLTGVVDVAGGGFHSLALKANGTVVNWGYGPYGTAPGGFNTGRKLSGGEQHTLALKTDGTVAAWPTNATDGQATVPGGLTNVFDVAAGEAFSLALRDLNVPVAQTITFAALADQGFTATPITLSATASSGLVVAFAVQSGPASISGNNLTLTGTGTVTVRATQAGDATYAAATPVDRSFAVTANFASWRLEKFTVGELADANVSGPNAIFGQDGLPNLVKYALGLEPKVNATSGLPAVTTTATDWVYTYAKPVSVTDVTYAVEISTNLTGWTASGVSLTLVSSAAGVETWQATYPLNSAVNAFFRLRVTQ